MAGLEIALIIIWPLIFIPLFLAFKRFPSKFKNGLYFVASLTYVLIVSYGTLFINMQVAFSFLEFSLQSEFYAILIAISFSALLLTAYNIGHGYTSSVIYDSFFYILLSGLAGSILSANLLTSYVFLELMLFSASYLIFSIKGAVKAAYKYTFMNMVGTMLLLLALILYSSGQGSQFMGLSLLVGLMIKCGLIPLHIWVADAYARSPIPIAIMLATGVNAAALLTLYKFSPLLDLNALGVVGLLTALIASFVCIDQRLKMRKTFAYFSIAETGFVVYGISLSSPIAVQGFLILLLTQMFAKSILFQFSGLVTEVSGLIRAHHNIALFSFFVAIFSICGIPLTGGFIGKVLIVLATLKSGNVLAAALFTISSLFLVIGALRAYKRFAQLKPTRIAYSSSLTAMLLSSVVTIVIGLSAVLLWI